MSIFKLPPPIFKLPPSFIWWERLGSMLLANFKYTTQCLHVMYQIQSPPADTVMSEVYIRCTSPQGEVQSPCYMSHPQTSFILQLEVRTL